MISSVLRVGIVALSGASILQAATPDISNMDNCIAEVRQAAAQAPDVLTFDQYASDYQQLMADLKAASPHLPHVYQQVAAGPLVHFLQTLGEEQFLQIFSGQATDEQTATLQQIVPDAALAILTYRGKPSLGVNAFEEIVSDLYDSFLSDEARVSKQTGQPINPPTYGTIPPLVKFGSADAGPYTWPGDATKEILGMGCGVVSLPPAQMNGGLIAWAALGHETGGHDVTHADKGLLDELAQKVHAAVLNRFKSQGLADYWARCIDETAADICGYLNIGPSFGAGLIGYFRALGDGKLRAIGSSEDPHPIDLLRGYLGAAVVKRLPFQDARAWSQAIAQETKKDNGALHLADASGHLLPFPVSFDKAVASTDLVAQTIMQAKLSTLQGHSLQELQNWTDADQTIVDDLVSVLNTEGKLPATLKGPGFYASYVIAAATQAALAHGANIHELFSEMQNFLAEMHLDNPTWSKTATPHSIALIEEGLKGAGEQLSQQNASYTPHIFQPKLPELVTQ